MQQHRVFVLLLASCLLVLSLSASSSRPHLTKDDEIFYCYEYGKGYDQFQFKQYYAPLNETQWVAGYLDQEDVDTYLQGHLRFGIYTMTTLYYYEKQIWYAAVHSFANGTFPPPEPVTYGDGLYMDVIDDQKVGYLTKPQILEFRSCTPQQKKQHRGMAEAMKKQKRIEFQAKLQKDVSTFSKASSSAESNCFTYDGSEFNFNFTYISKDDAGNTHFAGLGYPVNGNEDTITVNYGYYQPQYNLTTFHVFYMEQLDKSHVDTGKVQVMQWKGSDGDNGLVYELNYPYFESQFLKFKQCK